MQRITLSCKKVFFNIVSFIIAVMLCTPGVNIVNANNMPALQVLIQSLTVSPDGTVSVPINLINVPAAGISGANFFIKYNPDHFDFVSLTSGNIIKNQDDLVAAKDLVTDVTRPGVVGILYSDSKGGDVPITSDGTFAYLNLKLKQGVSNVNDTIGIWNPDATFAPSFCDKDANAIAFDASTNFLSGTLTGTSQSGNNAPSNNTPSNPSGNPSNNSPSGNGQPQGNPSDNNTPQGGTNAGSSDGKGGTSEPQGNGNGNVAPKAEDKIADQVLSKIDGSLDATEAEKLMEYLVSSDKNISPDKAYEVVAKIIGSTKEANNKMLQEALQLIVDAGKVSGLKAESQVNGRTLLNADLSLSADFIEKMENELKDIAKKLSPKEDSILLAQSIKDASKITFSSDIAGPADFMLPASAIAKMQDNAIGFAVETADTKLSFPAGAIAPSDFGAAKYVFISNATSGLAKTDDLSKKIAKQNPDMLQSALIHNFNLNMADDNNHQTPIHMLNDTIKIEMKLGKADLKGITDVRKAGLYFVKDDGTLEYEPSVVNSAYAIFSTTHLSSYAVMQYNKTFKDIKNNWAKDAIEVLASKHIVTGTDNGQTTFNPDGKLTRAQLVSLIARALNLKADNKKSGFSDVSDNAWYSQAVKAAKEAGIISGDNTGKFNPDKLVSREEMAKIVVTAYEAESGRKLDEIISKSSAKYKDDSKISLWAADYVKAAKVLNLVSGTSGGNYSPKDSSKRDQAAKAIYSMLVKLQLI